MSTREPTVPSGDDPHPPKRTTVERVRVENDAAPAVLEEVVPPPPDAAMGGREHPSERDEFVYIAADGTVVRQAERVDQASVRRPRSGLWAALLVILALALGAVAAAWYLTLDDNTDVPSVIGMPLDDAVARVEDDGFKSSIVSQPNEAAEQGTVFGQNPEAGTEHEKGSTVQLLVSKGPNQVAVPNAVGISERQARDRLATAGLKVEVVEVFSDSTRIGFVASQSPDASTRVAKESTVKLEVSKGSATVSVPNVVGATQDEATSRLEAAGLRANVVHVPAEVAAGTVVAQNPKGGQAKRGSTVRLNVSRGEA